MTITNLIDMERTIEILEAELYMLKLENNIFNDIIKNLRDEITKLKNMIYPFNWNNHKDAKSEDKSKDAPPEWR
jgi:hypothetical protein